MFIDTPPEIPTTFHSSFLICHLILRHRAVLKCQMTNDEWKIYLVVFSVTTQAAISRFSSSLSFVAKDFIGGSSP